MNLQEANDAGQLEECLHELDAATGTRKPLS